VTTSRFNLFTISGPKKINFYLCSGQDPHSATVRPNQLKFRGAMFAIYSLSLFIFTFLPFQIWKRKNKIRDEENATLSSVDQQDQLRARSNLLIEVFRMAIIVLLLTSLLLAMLYSSTIDPFNINRFTNLIIFFFANTILPPSVVFIFCISYYITFPNRFQHFLKSLVPCNYVRVME
jgi:hypothetical protein